MGSNGTQLGFTWALIEAEGEPGSFLKGQIPCRKDVGMTDAEEKIYLCGPGAYPANLRHRVDGVIGRHLSKSAKVEGALIDCFGNGPQCREFRARQARTHQCIGIGCQHRLRVEAIKGRT